MTVLFSDITFSLRKSRFTVMVSCNLSLEITYVRYTACRGRLRNLGEDSYKIGLHWITVT